MPQIYLCFLWHMHQPFYKDLVSGEYKLPWTRMHALKDYYGMARILEEFPQVRQTFNLVPSMMAQVAEYASGEAARPVSALALKPAESLTDGERAFLMRHSFYSRSAAHDLPLPALRRAVRRLAGAEGLRNVAAVRRAGVPRSADVVAAGMVRRGVPGRGSARSASGSRAAATSPWPTSAAWAKSSARSSARCCRSTSKLAAAGQIEISTTPYYHPILPLLCDSNIAAVSHPGVPLPPRFRYPQDARRQLAMARDYIARAVRRRARGAVAFGGSVSDEVFAIAAELGFEWAATDSGVLNRTLGRARARGGPVPALSLAAGRPAPWA